MRSETDLAEACITAPKVDKPTIKSIQVMRGIAALVVAIYHTHLILGQPEYGGYSTFADVTSRGWMGVNLFFILSGFIIIFAHFKDINHTGALATYGWRRFVRVYPVYWIFLIPYMVASFVGFGSAKFSWDALNLVSVFSLIRFNHNLTLPLQVAWTLFYEVQFYALFALLIFNKKIGMVAFTLWFAAILICSFGFGMVDTGPFHMWNIYFFFGLGVYFLYKKIDMEWGFPILLVGIAAFALTYCIIPDSRVNIVQQNPLKLLLIAFPFAAIVLGGAVVERKVAWTPPKFLLLLGNATYSIYIVHSPAISFIAILNKKLGHGLIPAPLLFILTATLATSVGIIAHLIIEKPLLAFLRQPKWWAGPAMQPAKNRIN